MDGKRELVGMIEGQDDIIIKIMNDMRIPSYIRDGYADKYNDLHLKIASQRVDGDDSN